jgi:hypothetical protein|tara:strand:+ start:59 stop:463 length:405 start_codon:yes stop_codon:yes gene_type:complete
MITATFRRTFAKGGGATADAMDDMEQGFAGELKKVKGVIAPMYELPKVREEPTSEFMEEMTRAAIIYNRECQKENVAHKLALQMKIQLKKEAVNALPDNFKGCRNRFDRLTAPLDRTPATYTPPIPGFKLFKED